MGAGYHPAVPTNDLGQIYDVLFTNQDHLQSLTIPADDLQVLESAVFKPTNPELTLSANEFALRLVQDRTDIDISGPEFNFVRSIRVYDVLIDDDRDDGDCDRYARVRIGTYDTQGGFSWKRSNRSAIPMAFGRTSHGCSLFARAVFVDWRDYVGNYGFERIDY